MNLIKLTITDPETGEDVERDVPGIWEICERCSGNGSHTNTSIDGHGITSEEWERDWDDESRDGYFSGDYDVACEAGCVNGKVLVPDIGALEPDLQDMYRREQEIEAQCRREDAATRRMEQGGYDG